MAYESPFVDLELHGFISQRSGQENLQALWRHVQKISEFLNTLQSDVRTSGQFTQAQESAIRDVVRDVLRSMPAQ